MIGNAGSALWQHLRHTLTPLVKTIRSMFGHALKCVNWLSRSIRSLSFEGPPFFPFQRWAERAAPASPSPLGFLSIRVRIVVRATGCSLFGPPSIPVMCLANKPLRGLRRSTLPQDLPGRAFTGSGTRLIPVRSLLQRKQGACAESGCQARLACPVGCRINTKKRICSFICVSFSP